MAKGSEANLGRQTRAHDINILRADLGLTDKEAIRGYDIHDRFARCDYAAGRRDFQSHNSLTASGDLNNDFETGASDDKLDLIDILAAVG